MLDYYFCEECETYHQPNRIINGQILSACEREISSLTQTEDSNTNSRHQINQSRKSKQIDSFNQYINDSPVVKLQYQTPHRQSSEVYFQPFRAQKSGTKYQNMPFMSIINQQNKQHMNSVMMKKQQQVYISPKRAQRFLSPKSVRQQIPIRKSISPPIRIQNQPIDIRRSPPRMVGPSSVTTSIAQPLIRTGFPLVVNKQVSTQHISPKTLVSKPVQTITPIQTMQKIIAKPNYSTVSPVQTMVSIPLIQEPSVKFIRQVKSEPIIKILSPPSSPPASFAHFVKPPSPSLQYIQQKPQIRPYNIVSTGQQISINNIINNSLAQNRISLQRVSGQRQPEQPEPQSELSYNQNQGAKVLLDRISVSYDPNTIVQEGEEDNQCCGKMCYH